MFTGIITDIGKVTEIEERGDTRFRIATIYDADGIDLGASIACSGACLTVIEKGRVDDTTFWLDVEAS
ncbi:MAG: riboflavin synthase, partial [Pseudomonadota bacterium]